jgi:hypothetical protein
LSPGQASYVVERLLAERRVSPGEVNRYLSEMEREIGDLERRLQNLRDAQGGSSSNRGSSSQPQRRGPGRPPRSAAQGGNEFARGGSSQSQQGSTGGAPKARRQKTAITPEQLASRQLQGRYLALIRQIPAARRAQYQRVAKEQGREAAIVEMQGVVGKK